LVLLVLHMSVLGVEVSSMKKHLWATTASGRG
jgi:hypothetical protein